MNRRRGNSIQKTIKDYMVPIIWILLVLILIFSIFSGSEKITPLENTQENTVWLNVSLDNELSSATIVYPWDYKTEVEWQIELYKWEKVIVKEWKATIFNSSWLNFRLNKLAELKYLENSGYWIYNWEVWLDTNTAIDIDMNFAKLKIWENSHISFSQNEVWSTIYVISWKAEINNLVWENTVLWSGQKITISRLDASNQDVDLSNLKEELDDYFIRSEWFLLNNGNLYLESNTEEDEIDSETSTGTIISNNLSSIISFNNLLDWAYVSASSIDISGNYIDEEIKSIKVNWKEAVLNTTNKTFLINDVNTSSVENDLVFKVYDDSNDMLSRFVYTVYYNSGNNSNSSNSTSWFTVSTFDVDGSKFTFTWPTTKNTYTTFETFVTIKWSVLTDWIDEVSVNDYKLSSFNWTSWRYHANVDYNNLWLWTNVYEVKYFSNWKVVYKNYFTIIKKDANNDLSSVEIKETEIISNEVN